MATLTDDEIDFLVTKAKEGKPVDPSEQKVTYGEPVNSISDQEIDFLVNERNAKREKENPVKEPSVVGDLARGIDNLQSTGGGLGALLGNLTNLKSVEDWGMEVYRANEFQASRNPRGVATFDDIHGIGDTVKYVEQGIMENLPMFVPGIGTSAIGGIAARSMAKGFIEKAVAQQLAKGLTRGIAEENVAKLVAKRIGISAAVSGLSSSAPMEAGSIYPDVYDETGVKAPITAMGYGLAAGIFDVIPEGRFFAHALGPGLGGRTLAKLAVGMGIEGTKQAILEGSTETLQTIIEEAAKHAQDPNYDIFSDERIKQYRDTFATAAPLGGLMGAGAETKGAETKVQKALPPHPDPLVNEKQSEVESKADAIVPEPITVNPIAAKLDEVTDQISNLSGQQAQLPADHPQRASIQTELESLIAERERLSTELERSTATDESQVSPTAVSSVPRGIGTIEPEGELRGSGTEGEQAPAKDGSTLEVKPTAIDPYTELTEPVIQKFKNQPLPEGLTPQAVLAKRQEMEGVTAALVNEKDATQPPEQKKAYVQAVREAVEPYLNFLAGENIKLRFSRAQGYGATIGGRGNKDIVLSLPTLDYFNARNEAMAKKGGLPRDNTSHAKVFEEEIIHAADLVAQRRLWDKQGRKGDFGQFVKDTNAKHAGQIRSTMPTLEKALGDVYSPSNPDLDDDTLSSEFRRAVLQRARTGQLTEDFHRLNAFARNGGRVTGALKTFIATVKRLKDALTQMVSKGVVTHEIKKSLSSMNKVLDEYGIVQPNPKPVLVNERTAPKQEVKKEAPKTPKAKATPKVQRTPSVKPAVAEAPVTGFLPTAKSEEAVKQPEKSTRPVTRGLRNYIKEVKALKSEENVRIPEKRNIRMKESEDIVEAAGKADSIYQGEVNGLHAFKELNTGGNFSIKSEDLTPARIEEEAQKVRDSFDTPTVTEDTLDQFLRDNGFRMGESEEVIHIGNSDTDLKVTPDVKRYFSERKSLVNERDEANNLVRIYARQTEIAKKAWHDVQDRVRELADEFGVVQEVGLRGALPRQEGDIGLLSGVNSDEAEEEIKRYRVLKKNFDAAFEIEREQRAVVNQLDASLDKLDREFLTSKKLSGDNLVYVLESRQYTDFGSRQQPKTRLREGEQLIENEDFRTEIGVAEKLIQDEFSATRMESGDRRLRTGAPSLDLEHVPEVDQEYHTQPRSETLINAAREIKTRGFFDTLQDILIEGTAAIDRRWRQSGENPNHPAETKQAILEIMRRALDGMIERYQTGDSLIEDSDQVKFLYRARAQVTQASLEHLRSVGRAGDILRGFALFGTRATTLNDYVKLITAQLKKKFGKAGEEFNRMAVEEINFNAQKIAEQEAGRSKALSYYQKILKDLNDPKWRAAARKSFAKEGSKLRAAVHRMVMKASQDEFGNFDSEPALKEAMARLLGAVQFIPKTPSGESATTALSSAITKVFNDAIKNNNLVNEKPKARTKIEDLQKLSAILQSQELYHKFVDEYEQKILNKLANNPEASPEMTERVNRLIDTLRSKSWSEDLIKSVVVNQAKAMKLNIYKAVKKTETAQSRKGITKIERLPQAEAQERIRALREAILKDAASGLSEERVQQLAEAIDNELERKVDEAREKWAGSPGAVRKTIKEINKTVAEIAKSGFQRREELENDLVRHFIKQLGLADEKEFPHATTLASIFKQAVHAELSRQRETLLNNIKKKAERLGVKALGNEMEKKIGSKTALNKVIDIAALGGLEDQDVYNALQKQLGLPPFNPEDAKKMQDMAEEIANMLNPREKKIAQQNLLNFMQSRKGLSWKDMTLAYMYVSMLSGPGTHLVNAFSNAGNLLGEMAVQAALHPTKTKEIFSTVFQSLTRAKVEFKETMKHGVAAGKEFYKAIGNTPLEYVNPVYNDKVAKGLGWFLNLKYVNAKIIGRLLAATDMFFYKAARELAYYKKGGEVMMGTWQAALNFAEGSVAATGVDITSSAGRAQVELLAMDHFEQQRQDWENNPEDARRWEEAHQDALRSTFNQEPIGPIGEFARMLGKWSADYPLAKLVVPFTKVVANVLNMQIEWSPLGFNRWWWSKDSAFNEGFKNDNGEAVRNPEILMRAILGSLGTMALGALLIKAHGDNPDDPWLDLYGDGPRDANLRRQLYDRGWKPNTFKVGHSFITYQNTVFALPFAALGSLMDRHRENPGMSVWDYAPQAAIAFARSALNQSFLSGLADLVSSVESSSPDKQVQRTMARAATVFVPSLFRQVDAWIDPSVQNSKDMLDMTIKQVPIVRQLFLDKPQLNVFGQPVKRVQGPFNIPFTNRFWTNERTDDPVLSFIGTHQLSVPGYSRNTKLNNVQMTEEQYYDYIALSGPMVYDRIKHDLPNLVSLTREEMQKRIRDISNSEKDRAREIMKSRKK